MITTPIKTSRYTLSLIILFIIVAILLVNIEKVQTAIDEYQRQQEISSFAKDMKIS
jgi:cell division protein FtsL